MAKWQFYVSCPSGNYWNPYETVEAGIFEGTLQEAQAELSERIRRTWSPYVTHNFQDAEQSVQPDEWKCPHCEAPNIENYSVCGACGKPTRR